MSTHMTKPIDLDAQIPPASTEPAHTVQVKLFDRQWTIVCDANSYAITAMSAGDVDAYKDFIVNAVVEEQRAEMKDALLRQRGLTNERFVAIVNAMLEVVFERPTKSASASSRTPAKRASAPRSTASSSRGRVVRSAR